MKLWYGTGKRFQAGGCVHLILAAFRSNCLTDDALIIRYLERNYWYDWQSHPPEYDEIGAIVSNSWR